MRKLKQWLSSAAGLRRIMNLYGPYLGAGIKVNYVSEDFRRAEVEMRLRWYNRNYVGVHFGGSLYAMVDPFYMLLLMNTLGRDYIVWDSKAEIEFVKPGRGTVRAQFELTDQMLDEIHQATQNGEKFMPTYDVLVKDAQDEVVAKVRKTLYIRKKP